MLYYTYKYYNFYFKRFVFILIMHIWGVEWGVHMWSQNHQRPAVGIKSQGAGATGVCEWPVWVWEAELGPWLLALLAEEYKLPIARGSTSVGVGDSKASSIFHLFSWRWELSTSCWCHHLASPSLLCLPVTCPRPSLHAHPSPLCFPAPVGSSRSRTDMHASK